LPTLNAINRTDVDTEQLLCADTGLTYYKGQAYSELTSFVVIRIDLDEVAPLLRNVVLSEDCLNWTGGFTRSAVNAFIRMYVQEFGRFEVGLILSRVNAIHRADVYAGSVLCPYAGFRDHISHLKPKPP
jgi:hypothetical protein